MNEYLSLIGVIPFLVLFIGLTMTKYKSSTVSFLTLCIVIIFAHVFWKTDAEMIARSTAEGFIFALIPIIWVIFAAVFTYYLSVESKGIDSIKKFLVNVSPDKNIQAVIIAFCFGGFLESVAGFGTAVAIPTAMLISIGFKPVKSAVISLVANSVPVAFGALGIPVIALAQITQLDLHTLTVYVAYQLLPFALFIPAALLFIANGRIRGTGKSMGDALFIGAVFTVVQTLIAVFVGPELVAVGGSLVSLIAFIVYRKFRSGKKKKEKYAYLIASVVNYIILLVLVLLTRLIEIPALKSFPFAFKINVGVHPLNIEYLTTPGTLLFISAIIGGMMQGVPVKRMGAVMLIAFDKIKFSALTILAIVALAKVMGNSGMIASVALSLAALSGSFYPFIAPLIGAIGTFVTGSDTSSNILLGELQKTTAINSSLPVEWITASNTAGATAGKMISPQSISVAASTVGITNQESRIMRGTLLYCLGYVVILGAYVYAATRITGLW